VAIPRAGVAAATGDDELERQVVKVALGEIVELLRSVLAEIPEGFPDLIS